MPRKRNKHLGGVPNDSAVNAANAAGRIQKTDANISNCDLKNLNLSQPDDDATSNRELPSAFNVNLSADKNQEKCVPKDLNRNKSVCVCKDLLRVELL